MQQSSYAGAYPPRKTSLLLKPYWCYSHGNWCVFHHTICANWISWFFASALSGGSYMHSCLKCWLSQLKSKVSCLPEKYCYAMPCWPLAMIAQSARQAWQMRPVVRYAGMKRPVTHLSSRKKAIRDVTRTMPKNICTKPNVTFWWGNFSLLMNHKDLIAQRFRIQQKKHHFSS